MYITLRDTPGPDRPSGETPATPVRRPVGRVVLVLGVVSLLTDISSESVSAILPLYLTGVVGLSALAYGFVDGLHQGMSALVRLGGGWLADRTDRPKWVALAGYGLSALARVFLLFAQSLGSVATVVAADRVGKGIRTAPRDAMISASSDPRHLGRAFGVHRMLDTIGAALGPLIAFAILWAIPEGYSSVLVVSLAFAVLGVALLALFGPDQRLRDAPTTVPTPPAFRWSDLGRPRLRSLLMVAGSLALLTIGDGFIYLALLEHGEFAAQWFPLLYVGTNVAYLVLAVPVGRWADRVGRARMLVLGHLALAGAYLTATVPTSAAVAVVLTLLLLGAFYAATDGVTAAVAGSLVPPQARSSGIAAAQTVVALARMASSFAFGFGWLLVGPAVALTAAAVAVVLVVLVTLRRADSLDRLPETS